MKKMVINVRTWKVAVYFLLFEMLFWVTGVDIFRAGYFYITKNVPFITNIGEVGIFYNYLGVAISVLFLILSVFCLELFFRHLILEVRGIKNEV